MALLTYWSYSYAFMTSMYQGLNLTGHEEVRFFTVLCSIRTKPNSSSEKFTMDRYPSQKATNTFSHLHRTTEHLKLEGRDLGRSPCSSPLFKQGHLMERLITLSKTWAGRFVGVVLPDHGTKALVELCRKSWFIAFFLGVEKVCWFNIFSKH